MACGVPLRAGELSPRELRDDPGRSCGGCTSCSLRLARSGTSVTKDETFRENSLFFSAADHEVFMVEDWFEDAKRVLERPLSLIHI